VLWRDIPAQVIGKEGRRTVKKVLDPRFADAIDTAALRAGRGRSDLYLSDWRRETRPCEGDLEQVVNDEAARLESQFPPQVLSAVIQAGGVWKDKPAAAASTSVPEGPEATPQQQAGNE
jgi:hypothetical protein